MNTVSVADGIADLVRSEVRYSDGGRCELSKCELQLLSFLAHRLDTPVSRDELLAQLWKVDPARVLTRTIDMHVCNLRRKLRDRHERPALRTVRGHGYMLAGPGVGNR